MMLMFDNNNHHLDNGDDDGVGSDTVNPSSSEYVPQDLEIFPVVNDSKVLQSFCF